MRESNEGKRAMTETTDWSTVVFVAGLYAFCIYALIQWKFPLSNMNRTKFYERKSLRVSPEECKNVIKVRSFYIDKDRYIAARKAFLGMKMGYKPTDKKIERMLSWLRFSQPRISDEKKRLFTEIDVDILTAMRKELALGTLEIENYKAGYEEDEGLSIQLRTLPVGLALLFAYLNVIPAVMMLGFLLRLVPILGIPAPLGMLAAENVLRRSRNKSMRWLAHVAQVTIIAGLVVPCVLVVIDMIFPTIAIFPTVDW